MEIKLDNITTFNIKNIDLTFYENEITALISSEYKTNKEILDLISCENYKCIKSGNIKYGKEQINLEIKKDIFYLKSDSRILFNINIKEDIIFYIKNYDESKLLELLNTFNLNKDILNKNYIELSSSEYLKIELIIGFLSPVKVLLLDNPIINFDTKSIKSLIKILKNQKRLNKIIILTSNDTNFLLEICDRVVVFDNKKIIEDGNKFDIFSNEKLLKDINLEVPNVINFSNKVKLYKGKKIGYRTNINDLLKDIYRYAK